MKTSAKLFFVLILIFFKAINPTEAQTDLNITTNYQGYSRSFRVHVPPGYSPSQHIPLVLVYHEGGISNSLAIKTKTRFDLVGDTANFITVFPQALLGGVGGWADSRGTPADIAGIDDIGFTSFILDTIESLYNIDPTRIYAAGMSTGGVFCQRLALQLNSRIAAFASVGASLYASLLTYFPPSRKVPVLFMNGTSDARNRYYGGVGLSGLSSAINTDTATVAWATFDNCFPVSTVYEFPDINTTDLSTVTRFTYYPCQNCSEVILYRINNGGHTWPGGIGNNPILGNANKDINGSHEIWSFFKRHQLQCSGEDAGNHLINFIERLGLANGLENSLFVKIENALISCAEGNENAAINKLNAFINQVDAKRGSDLTNSEADQLIAFVQDLINSILDGTADCGSIMSMISFDDEGLSKPDEMQKEEVFEKISHLQKRSTPDEKGSQPDHHVITYPNPASNEINIAGTSSNNFSCELLDAMGKTIMRTEDQTTINISHLPAGIYFIKVTENQDFFISKVVIQH